MSDSNRTIRERMMDRVVLRYLGLIMFVTVLCPLMNSQLIVPYVVDDIPIYPDNPNCTDLPTPLGGNQRSLLAYRNNGPDALELDLSLSQSTYTSGDNIQLTITVKNNDRGPVIFLLPNQDPIVTSSPAVQGMTLELTAPDGRILDSQLTYQPGGIIPSDQLHLIGSGSRCKQTYTIEWVALQQLGSATLGDYRIRATYRNNQVGGAVVFPDSPNHWTPIPEYVNDQGIWTTNGITSNEVRFTFAAPAPVQPAQ